MEQVPAPQVVAIVERERRKHRNVMAYAIFDFDALGVPQSRKRLIAGSPAIVSRLLRASLEQPRRCVSSVIANPRGTHVRSSITWTCKFLRVSKSRGPKYTYLKSLWSDHCRSVGDVAPTVLAGRALQWVRPSGRNSWHSPLTPDELAALQTFPATYKWPANKQLAYQHIGNSVPPRVAELMLRGPSLRPVGSASASTPS